VSPLRFLSAMNRAVPMPCFMAPRYHRIYDTANPRRIDYRRNSVHLFHGRQVLIGGAILWSPWSEEASDLLPHFPSSLNRMTQNVQRYNGVFSR